MLKNTGIVHTCELSAGEKGSGEGIQGRLITRAPSPLKLRAVLANKSNLLLVTGVVELHEVVLHLLEHSHPVVARAGGARPVLLAQRLSAALALRGVDDSLAAVAQRPAILRLAALHSEEMPVHGLDLADLDEVQARRNDGAVELNIWFLIRPLF